MGRWARLAADLADGGVIVRVDERPFTEAVRGRVQHGVSRSITLRHPDGGTVEVRDRWWSKNTDVWLGWEVTRLDAEGVVRGRPVWSKKRSETVAAVVAALASGGAA